MFDPRVLNTTINWFEKAIPSPNARNIQTIFGVHFEEVAEMINTLRSEDGQTQTLLVEAYRACENLANHLKNNAPGLVKVEDEVELLDAVCDQIVTATGVGYHLGHDVLGGVDEVNRSNFSKFVKGKPIFDKNMKIIKGPDYSKAKLAQFVPAK